MPSVSDNGRQLLVTGKDIPGDPREEKRQIEQPTGVDGELGLISDRA